MRNNDEVIRNTEEYEDYVYPDKYQENIEDCEPEKYQENIVKNEITDD